MIIIPGKKNTSESNVSSWNYYLSHLLSSTALVFWFAVRTASAQTNEYAFGEMRTFPLSAKYDLSTVVSWDEKNATIAAWSVNRNEILIAVFDSAFSSVNFQLKYAPIEFDDLYAADLNNDGVSDFVLVNKRDKVIAFVLDTKPDTLRIFSFLKLPFEPENILLCDYNDDKRLDILVYTRKEPGILPLSNNGRGKFLPAKLLAPNNAIGAANFAFINNDNLVDLIFWDWIKSELHMLYGVGRGRFIDQSTFPVQGEVDEIIAAQVVRGHSLDLVMKMTNPSEFQIWEGDDFGDFKRRSTVAVKERPIDFKLGDVNNDGLTDIITTIAPASLKVLLNSESDAFSDRVTYASGENPTNVFVPSKNKSGLVDCIVFDRSLGQFIVYKNAARSAALTDSVQFATGIIPTEIISNDFNQDGVSDLALINTKGQSVSIYWGRKASIPFGPFTYSLSGEPSHIAFHSITDTTLQLVLSFPKTNQVSYLTIGISNYFVSNAFIGSEGDAQLLSANRNQNNRAEFITANSSVSEGSSISFYEQLGPSTFIERTFRLSPPDFLLGASVADLNRDRFQDIVYAYRLGDTSMVELGVAFGDSSFMMKRRIVSRELALPDVRRIFIYLVDFDKDGVLDLLMHAGPPVNYLLAAKEKEDGYYFDPKIITSGVFVEERANIQLIDYDGDGWIDIVIGSQKLGQVILYRNQGEFNFGTGIVLTSEKELSHFTIGDIDGDGVNDLALTLSKKGVLKIINGRRLPLHSKSDTKR